MLEGKPQKGFFLVARPLRGGRPEGVRAWPLRKPFFEARKKIWKFFVVTKLQRGLSGRATEKKDLSLAASLSKTDYCMGRTISPWMKYQQCPRSPSHTIVPPLQPFQGVQHMESRWHCRSRRKCQLPSGTVPQYLSGMYSVISGTKRGKSKRIFA